MNLTDYIRSRGGTATATCPQVAEISAKAGCAKATLYMVANGHKRPGWRLVDAIERATDGEVSRHDLRPDIWPVPQEGRAGAM